MQAWTASFVKPFAGNLWQKFLEALLDKLLQVLAGKPGPCQNNFLYFLFSLQHFYDIGIIFFGLFHNFLFSQAWSVHMSDMLYFLLDNPEVCVPFIKNTEQNRLRRFRCIFNFVCLPIFSLLPNLYHLERLNFQSVPCMQFNFFG